MNPIASIIAIAQQHGLQGLLQHLGINAQGQQSWTPEQNQQWQLNTLRQNTIDQTPYTPQAAQYIKTLPMQAYGNAPVNSLVNDMTGGMYAGGGGAGGTVDINQHTLNDQSTFPVTGFRHEAIHSMDANVNYPTTPADFPPPNANFIDDIAFGQGGTSTDSTDFYNNIAHFAPQQTQALVNGPLRSPIYALNADVRNHEGLAYFGQNPNQAMLQSPQMASFYSNIYQPMSKAINYSPVYSTTQSRNSLPLAPGWVLGTSQGDPGS